MEILHLFRVRDILEWMRVWAVTSITYCVRGFCSGIYFCFAHRSVVAIYVRST